MNTRDVVWTEKYRPKKIDDMVGEFKDKIKKHLQNPNAMPHMLFYSVAPGTGKTTIAKVIIDELDADALFLNSSDDRKIETVREKVNSFVQTKSSKIGKRRIVFLDEVDGMTGDAQRALRNVMETYAGNALFILTCNTISKIIEPVQSRCGISINFGLPIKSEIKDYLVKICESEGLKYSEQGLMNIIEENYPSIRNCVQVLQDVHIEGLDINDTFVKSAEEEHQVLWNTIVTQKDWKSVKDYIFTNSINVKALNKFFWLKAVETSNIKMIQITASNEKAFKDGEDIIIFVTSLIDMVK